MADKKSSLLYVLKVLQEYSDSEHKLSQSRIKELLKKKYNITLDRKTIKDDIITLIEMKYNIDYTPKTRMSPNKKTGKIEKNEIMTEVYLEHDFDDSELKLLIDSVLFSPYITTKQSKDLINKLSSLSSQNFNPRIKHVYTMPVRKGNNQQLSLSIDTIDEAIAKKCKITYKHMSYDTIDGFKVTKSARGTDQLYKVSPYHIAMCEGKYYLICGGREKVFHLDIDRLRDVSITEEKIVPYKELVGSSGQSLNLKEYMNEHIFMCAGEPIRIKLRIVSKLLYEAVNTFGKDIKITEHDDTILDIDVKAAKRSVEQFLRRHTPLVTILEPQEFVDEMTQLFAVAASVTKNGHQMRKKIKTDNK